MVRRSLTRSSEERVEVGATPAGGALPLWPLGLATAAYAVWWLLGLSAVAWPMVTVCLMLPLLVLRSTLQVPSGFGWWIGFCVWLVLSATQMDAMGRLASFGYRFSVYTAATIAFIYVYNASLTRARTHRVLTYLTVMWCCLAVGGLIGILAPGYTWTTPVGALLPGSVARNGLIEALTQARFSQDSRLFGLELGRPAALFPFTNGWGSAFGILLPAVLAWLVHPRTSFGGRVVITVILTASMAPVVVSLNRGLWLSLALLAIYVTLRLAARGQWLFVLGGMILVTAACVVIALTPLSTLVLDRSQGGHSDEGRASLYAQSIQAGLEEPILGHATPQPRSDQDDGPSVGTHGHAWLVLVSQGVVGVVLYFGWWVTALARGWRQRSTSNVILYATLPVVFMQSFVYEHTPAQLPLAMVIAALVMGDPRKRE